MKTYEEHCASRSARNLPPMMPEEWQEHCERVRASKRSNREALKAEREAYELGDETAFSGADWGDDDNI